MIAIGFGQTNCEAYAASGRWGGARDDDVRSDLYIATNLPGAEVAKLSLIRASSCGFTAAWWYECRGVTSCVAFRRSLIAIVPRELLLVAPNVINQRLLSTQARRFRSFSIENHIDVVFRSAIANAWMDSEGNHLIVKALVLSWRVVLIRHDSIEPGWSMCATIEMLVYTRKDNADGWEQTGL